MIAVDTNILVYAHREDSDWHAAALAAMRELAESGKAWGIPWPVLHEFLAIVTHTRIYRVPTPLSVALEAVEAWLDAPTCRVLGEGPQYFRLFKQIVLLAKVTGARLHDARIAAVCLDNGVTEFWTADRDFSRFRALRCRNPLGYDRL